MPRHFLGLLLNLFIAWLITFASLIAPFLYRGVRSHMDRQKRDSKE